MTPGAAAQVREERSQEAVREYATSEIGAKFTLHEASNGGALGM